MAPNQERNLINRFGWLIVLAACLTLSTWSLYYVLRHYGAPIFAASITSAIFDGAAILAADYSIKYARIGESGLAPRIGVIVFAGLSAFLNAQHAALARNPSPAVIAYAAPPIIAVVIYDFHTRWIRRRALKNSGRIAAPMPVFGRHAWFLFPIRTFKDVRAITRYRGAAIRAAYAPGMYDGTDAEYRETLERFANTPAIPLAIPADMRAETHRLAREWARQRGMAVSLRGPVSDNIVNQYLAARALPPGRHAAVSERVSNGNPARGFRVIKFRKQDDITEPEPETDSEIGEFSVEIERQEGEM